VGELTIVGLGPGDPKLLTLQAYEILLSGVRLVLRTQHHPAADFLQEKGVVFTTLDSLYESADSFEALEETAAKAVRGMLDQGDVCYAVPGQGLLEDGTAERLLGMRLKARVVPGISGADWAIATGAKKTRAAASGMTVLPASQVTGRALNPRVPLLVTQLDNPLQAGEIKPILQALYSDEAMGVFLDGKGARTLSLEELDRQKKIDHACAYFLPGKPESARYDFSDLAEVMERLRRECDWDREQTHESLQRYLIEECAEVLEAIDRDDPQALLEELGDVLLQVVFHSAIAQARGDFDILDVTDSECRKMRDRHPHIYGDAGEPADWETMKAEKRGHKTPSERMEAVAKSLPALLRAGKLLETAGRSPSLAIACEQLVRMARELPEAQDAERAAGDLLLAAADVCRLLGAEPELSLRAACKRLIERTARYEGDFLE